MSDNNWPDPARPGVPLNPEQSRWHWLKTPDGLEVPYEWRAAGECERGRWPAYWVSVDADDWQPAECTYLGPCLTPGEVGARVKEAVDLGRDNATRDLDPQIAMLIPWQTAIEDALSNWCDAVADDETPKDALRHLIQIEMDAALDPKVSQAAADLVAKAKRDALEEAARWHDEQTVWMIKGRRLAKAEEHRKHAAAIRALGEKDDAKV